MLGAVVDVVLGAFVDLDGGVLGVDLPLDEGLEDFWYPDIEADLTHRRDDFKGKVFLDATGIAEFSFVAEDAVERSKELLGGKLFFVVGAGDFEH